MGKKYSYFIRVMFGMHGEELDEQRNDNENQALADIIEEVIDENWDGFQLEHVVISQFYLNGKGTDDFAEFIRKNANELAMSYSAKALRTLRHPKNSRRISEHIIFKD